MNWMDIGAINETPLRDTRIVKTALGCVALFRTSEAEVFATSDRCPHKGGPLSEGIVLGRNITCPLHSWVFSLETGQAQGADVGQIAAYAVKVSQGRIFLDATDLAKRSAA